MDLFPPRTHYCYRNEIRLAFCIIIFIAISTSTRISFYSLNYGRGESTQEEGTRPAHPPAAVMVASAIESLKERNGVIAAGHQEIHRSQLQGRHGSSAAFHQEGAENGVTQGKLVQAKGKGASGSFKLNAKAAKEEAAQKAKKEKEKIKRAAEKEKTAAKAKALKEKKKKTAAEKKSKDAAKKKKPAKKAAEKKEKKKTPKKKPAAKKATPKKTPKENSRKETSEESHQEGSCQKGKKDHQIGPLLHLNTNKRLFSEPPQIQGKNVPYNNHNIDNNNNDNSSNNDDDNNNEW